ncbi:hypothetical protein Poly51_24980 [Rubripirellula tenax]|uniref:Uncharacterized protein n=1 Tax=Rubripirellula tenax TaxID=2528015 RepID=A0A5C6F6H3_9BACT|nr:hypothetical protein [Rubripirellula tenax]TWU56582.1 hypothetical protein Poly51_24980 [Rubripirellula tenax]
MINRIILAAGLVASAIVVDGSTASASDPLAVAQVWNYNYSMNRPWHGNYYNQNYGQPLALVVPPTAHMRQTYSWGVSQNKTYPIYHQFGRSANSPGAASQGQFMGTPNWPSHTDQFGTYYVRGPW